MTTALVMATARRDRFSRVCLEILRAIGLLLASTGILFQSAQAEGDQLGQCYDGLSVFQESVLVSHSAQIEASAAGKQHQTDCHPGESGLGLESGLQTNIFQAATDNRNDSLNSC